MEITETLKTHLRMIEEWRFNVFLFAETTMKMKPAEPLDELLAAVIPYTDPYGTTRSTILFDIYGRLVHYDLKVYERWMFKRQDRTFSAYHGSRFTWQQTVILEAYNRAISTFDRDSFDDTRRWISVVAGHGIGKTADMSVIALHFLTCFFHAQIGMTSATQQQVEDIFMKEFWRWNQKMPVWLAENLEQTADHIRVKGTEDWFLRAQVARQERPEALAGLHGTYVLILVDECSGVPDNVLETMKGALTGQNYVVLYFSNGTRTEGEFFDSHTKNAGSYTALSFNAEESPIVQPGSIERWLSEANGNREEDVYRIRVRGMFAKTEEMDEKGWIPLFANMTLLFEPERGQIINGAIIGVDPAGMGRDHTIIDVRDNVYLKEVLNEKTSSAPDVARKVETIRDAYNSRSSDIGIDAFGEGAKVVANIQTKTGESVNALLTDKPREGTEHEFNSFKSELAWKFRQWLMAGGIIITNNRKAWMDQLEKVKYKRDRQGRIALMDKVTFKKLYGFSPDRFDAAIHTFFKDDVTRAVVVPKDELQTREAQEFLARTMPAPQRADPYSSM